MSNLTTEHQKDIIDIETIENYLHSNEIIPCEEIIDIKIKLNEVIEAVNKLIQKSKGGNV